MQTSKHEKFEKDAKRLDLTEALLERLRGRMSVIQPKHERYQVALDALEAVCANSADRFSFVSSDSSKAEFLQDFLSYDLIEEFLSDPVIEDITINATEPIFVHKTGEGLVKTDRRFTTNRELVIFVKKLVTFAGRNEVDPINDIELYDIRGRVNITHSPFGPQITITRGKPNPLTIFNLIENQTLSYEMAAQLWMYVEGLCVRPANLMISGGPGTGKTTLLNAILGFIPSKNRLVIIEDTLELNTSFLENCSRLESCRRVKLPDLVKNSLRMRPERIMVGEVRGSEANDLMTAMNLGKYCMSTIHASTARETILRLQNEPMNVPPILISLVDVFIMLRKMNLEGKVMRVVSEVVETAGLEKNMVLLSTIWSYDHSKSQIIETSPSSVYRDKLAYESGRTSLQIMEETARRAKVLKAMHDANKFTNIASFTEFCQKYSENSKEAISELGHNVREVIKK